MNTLPAAATSAFLFLAPIPGSAGLRSAALILGAVALGRVLRALLYEVSPTDPLTLVAVAATMAGAAWVAGYIPARRATAIDPIVTMKTE